jgi:hypothetical protein
MITTKSSVDKRIFDWQEQEQSNTRNDIGSALFWTKNLIFLSVGTIILTAFVTVVAVVYWCSRQQKSKSQSSELTSFSTNLINSQTPRPKEIKLFPIIPKLVQPTSPTLILPSIEKPNHHILNGDTFATDTCSTAGSSSTSTAASATKKFRKKNLLERRGSNNSLTISIAPKHRPVNSPPVDCPSDEYLLTATRKLTIEELHKHAQDARSLYQEFWVCISSKKKSILPVPFRQFQPIILKNFVFVVLEQRIVTVQSLLMNILE